VFRSTALLAWHAMFARARRGNLAMILDGRTTEDLLFVPRPRSTFEKTTGRSMLVNALIAHRNWLYAAVLVARVVFHGIHSLGVPL
jgi:hypothetical protein